MKFVFSIPVLLAVLTGSNSAIASQLTPASQANIPTEVASEKQKSPSSSTEGSVSFIRTFRNLLSANVQTIESDFALTANGSGFTFEVDIQSQTLFEQPNRFQSNIQFVGADGVAGSPYVITSDGQQVWVYDSLQNIYSVMAYETFADDYDDSFLIGFFMNFLLGVLEDTENTEDMETLLSIPEEELLQDEDLIRELEVSLELDDSEFGTEIVNGKTFTTFEYTDEQDGFTMKMFIDPTTSLIEDIHVSSQDSDFDMVMREDITHNIPPASTSPSDFTFIPPEGAQLSEEPISVSPF